MKILNKYSRTITQDETQPAAQAMLYTIGWLVCTGITHLM